MSEYPDEDATIEGIQRSQDIQSQRRNTQKEMYSSETSLKSFCTGPLQHQIDDLKPTSTHRKLAESVMSNSTESQYYCDVYPGDQFSRPLSSKSDSYVEVEHVRDGSVVNNTRMCSSESNVKQVATWKCTDSVNRSRYIIVGSARDNSIVSDKREMCSSETNVKTVGKLKSSVTQFTSADSVMSYPTGNFDISKCYCDVHAGGRSSSSLSFNSSSYKIIRLARDKSDVPDKTQFSSETNLKLAITRPVEHQKRDTKPGRSKSVELMERSWDYCGVDSGGHFSRRPLSFNFDSYVENGPIRDNSFEHANKGKVQHLNSDKNYMAQPWNSKPSITSYTESQFQLSNYYEDIDPDEHISRTHFTVLDDDPPRSQKSCASKIRHYITAILFFLFVSTILLLILTLSESKPELVPTCVHCDKPGEANSSKNCCNGNRTTNMASNLQRQSELIKVQGKKLSHLEKLLRNLRKAEARSSGHMKTSEYIAKTVTPHFYLEGWSWGNNVIDTTDGQGIFRWKSPTSRSFNRANDIFHADATSGYLTKVQIVIPGVYFIFAKVTVNGRSDYESDIAPAVMINLMKNDEVLDTAWTTQDERGNIYSPLRWYREDETKFPIDTLTIMGLHYLYFDDNIYIQRPLDRSSNDRDRILTGNHKLEFGAFLVE